MARANVPKFGNWETEENVPYTVYFDKARKTKTGGKMINPNDPLENPEMFAHLQPPPPKPRTRQEEPIRRGTVRPTPEQKLSREDGEFSNSSNYGQGQRPAARSRQKPGRGDESPEEEAAVPKFGGWDERDPQSAENFTQIFNKLREGRNHEGGGNAPKHHSSYTPRRNLPSNEPRKCCFPWW